MLRKAHETSQKIMTLTTLFFALLLFTKECVFLLVSFCLWGNHEEGQNKGQDKGPEKRLFGKTTQIKFMCLKIVYTKKRVVF